MNTNTKTFVIAGLLVVIALVAGILIGKGTSHKVATPAMHQMPNGEMMMNDGSSNDMHSMMDSMSMSLEGKTGDAFDQAFLKEMIVHHEGAVVMAQQVLATSKRPELIKLANDIISAQTKEIAQMKEWQKAWFR
jgi:uncharacterized protein (DUF305 family)